MKMKAEKEEQREEGREIDQHWDRVKRGRIVGRGSPKQWKMAVNEIKNPD